MKKIIIYSVLLLFLSSCKQNSSIISTKNCSASELHVYLYAPDKSVTDIHRTPKGEVITQLIIDDELNTDYFITVTEAKKGWFKVKSPIIGMDSVVEIPNGEGWIHGSVLAVDTRNYGGQHLNLLEKPVDGKTIEVIKNVVKLRVKDICGDWVKVEYNETTGWIESEWLCGNPLTNCN